MANRNTKRNTKRSKGLVARLYSPIGEVLHLASNSVGIVTNTTRNIVQRSINAVNKLGNSVTKRTDRAISGLTRRKRQTTRKQQRRGGRR